MRIQRGIRGKHRDQVSSRVNHDVERAIVITAERFQTSRSFVIHVACANFFGIEIEQFIKPRREQVDKKDKMDSIIQFKSVRGRMK